MSDLCLATADLRPTGLSLRELAWDHLHSSGAADCAERAINDAKDESRRETAADLLQEETRLNRRLEKLKLDLHVCKGDGNCQVR